jgi:threonine/homoserine/homoserine lactone efflux protein
MSLQSLTAVLIFSLVMGFTPGPNNIMLAASGARHGIRRTLPHMLGVSFGFPVMMLLVGLGLTALLLRWPVLQLAMKVAASAYLLWLAFQIARSSSHDGGKTVKPMTFLGAALFQWINVKAWLYAIGAISAYTSGQGRQLYIQVAIISLLSIGVSLLTSGTWMVFGAGIRRWLRTPRTERAFNLGMAASLVATTVPILAEIEAAL